MKWLIIVFLFPFVSLAQVDHHLGTGCYFNYSLPFGSKERTATTFDGRWNVSPFVLGYTAVLNRINAGIGFVYWHNGSRVTTVYPTAFGDAADVVRTKSREHYATGVLSLGYYALQRDAFNAGFNLKLMGRYLYHLHNDSVSSINSGKKDFYWGRLDSTDMRRFGLATGVGLYASYDIGRFTSVVEVGALGDIQKGDSTRYLNTYAGLSLRFRLNKERRNN